MISGGGFVEGEEVVPLIVCAGIAGVLVIGFEGVVVVGFSILEDDGDISSPFPPGCDKGGERVAGGGSVLLLSSSSLTSARVFETSGLPSWAVVVAIMLFSFSWYIFEEGENGWCVSRFVFQFFCC